MEGKKRNFFPPIPFPVVTLACLEFVEDLVMGLTRQPALESLEGKTVKVLFFEESC